jgi:hypothetical protein
MRDPTNPNFVRVEPQPPGIVPCPVCGSSALAWRLSDTPNSPTVTAVMCEYSDPIGAQNPLYAGCLLFLPPTDFYRATAREAVAFWNTFAADLIKLRASRATHG